MQSILKAKDGHVGLTLKSFFLFASKNCLLFLNSIWYFLILCSLSFAFVFASRNTLVVDYWLIFQSVAIGGICIYFLCNKKVGLLAQVVGVFVLLFFSLFPVLELMTATTYWGGAELNGHERSVANLAAAIFFILFWCGYLVDLPLIFNKERIAKINLEIQLKEQILLVVVALGSFVYLLSLLRWNVGGLFFRSGVVHEGVVAQSKTQFLIVEFFLRPLIFNIGIYLFAFCKKNRWVSFFMLALAILAMFPTGIPRFQVGAIYLPFLLIGFWSAANYLCIPVWGRQMILPNVLMMGIFLIFPVLDIFRWHAKGDSLNVFGSDTMLAGHFDAYQMLARALSVGNISHGEGFLGAVLFFIPREIWTSKPIGSGQIISHLSNLSFDNVSMPLVGEFYLNFGFFGVVICSIILGLLFRSMDDVARHFEKYKISVPLLIYLQSIGLIFLILRGGFLSAFAYTVAMQLSWGLIFLICRAAVFTKR